MKVPWDTIVWWEVRRIPFNLAVGLAGVISLVVIFLTGVPRLQPGEDLIEPLMLLYGGMAYAMLANLAYTMGWITELIWAWGDTSKTADNRRRVFRLGLAFAVAVTLLPGVLVPLSWAVFGFY